MSGFSHFVVHFLIILSPISDLYSCSCPEACEPCISEHLYCVNPGLTEIPTMVLPNLQKVTIHRQTFLNSDLSSFNVSSFIGISQLSIRSSNINKILPFTFSKLTSLQQLDLSDNAELTVKQMAFQGLNLNILKLDNMGLITLDLDAFQGLSVRSLSIQNSNLLTLPVKLIQPLSRSLRNLYLKNNHLRTLDARLQSIFQSMEVLEIQKNPFICNCSVLWLSKILQFSASLKTKSEEVAFGSSDEEYPQCVSPTELRKKYLHTISKQLTKCSPPNIIRIDISFQSYSSATIDCIADYRKDSHHQTFVGWLPSNESVIEITQLKHSVKVERHSNYQKYFCRAANVNGNSEIGFQINWLSSSKDVNNSFNRQKTQNNNTRDSSTVLWQNMFSLFEMICAILGTLIITVIIFLSFCCCHRCRLHIPFLEEERKFQYKKPVQYDQGLYSDHGRFYETDLDGNLFPPPPPTPPPFPTNRLIF